MFLHVGHLHLKNTVPLAKPSTSEQFSSNPSHSDPTPFLDVKFFLSFTLLLCEILYEFEKFTHKRKKKLVISTVHLKDPVTKVGTDT